MRVFEEKQRFRQWWLFVIVALTMGGLYVTLYNKTEAFQDLENNFKIVLTAIFATILIGGIFVLQLRTKIDTSGIKASFYPISFFTKQYTWPQIDKVYVRKYSPLTEYGGWGIKGLGSAKAYNVSGNYGIQIVTKEKKRFLIGTQKPQDAERVLKRYAEKFN